MSHADDMVNQMFDNCDPETWMSRHPRVNRVPTYQHWTQKSGKKIALTKMTDDHIRNTINLLKRKISDLPNIRTTAEVRMNKWIDAFKTELGKRKRDENI